MAETKAYHSNVAMSVTREDLKRLQPNRWLSNHIINYVIWTLANTYVKTRLGGPQEICFLPTLTWANYNSDQVYTPRTYTHPFRKPFVVLPMNINDNHWVVAFLAYCNTGLFIADGESEDKAAVFILDPMPVTKNKKKLEKSVIGFLKTMGRGEAGFLEPEVGKLPFYWPDIVSSQPARGRALD